jgi:tripartite-type tricarboxylate transporter receptor subunit TctC
MRKEMSFDDPTHCDERMQLVRLEAISWFGLLAPAHTAAPIIAKVHEEVVKIAAQADMRERLAQLGLEVAVNSPDEFVAVINADIAKWAKVIKDASIKLSE